MVNQNHQALDNKYIMEEKMQNFFKNLNILETQWHPTVLFRHR